MTPYVVDANAINMFQHERISGKSGEASAAISAIFQANCIALDNEKLCLQEWSDCAGGRFPYALMDWVVDEIVNGHIRLFGLANTSCKKHLASLGLPSKDHKWVRLAVGCDGKRLVSGDIDFFDPTKKRASADLKQTLRRTRTGACCKALEKVYGISVMCIEHVCDDISALPS